LEREHPCSQAFENAKRIKLNSSGISITILDCFRNLASRDARAPKKMNILKKQSVTNPV